MHLLYSSHFPQDLYLWKSDSTGHNPRWLKGASIFTIGEGQGDGYLYHSGGTYRYQMTQVGD